ncbi:MAG: hypothetical protein H8E14_18835 [Candidatus Marinimicrobia bacterium]|nr:hypothetical protein [Candidatus Neomarinimicrobiota bacterium]
MIRIAILITALLLSGGTGCNKNDCKGCGGGLIDGYLYKRVEQVDLEKLTTIFPDLQIEACIRFKLDLNGIDINLETVTVVDDCCCDVY